MKYRIPILTFNKQVLMTQSHKPRTVNVKENNSRKEVFHYLICYGQNLFVLTMAQFVNIE